MSEAPLLLIVGTGSRVRGDDSAGPYVIDILKERMDIDGCPEKVRLSLIDADVMPENYTKPIRESGAKACFFIDAVDMGMAPGTIRTIPRDMIDAAIPCSHSLPMSYVMENVNEKIPMVVLIGTQISTAGLFQEMSDPVLKACSELADIIWEGKVLEIPAFSKDETFQGKKAENYCW